MKTKVPFPATVLSATFFVGALATAAPIQPVSSLADAQQKLKAAPVEDSGGHAIGRVETVQPASGAPLNARIALNAANGSSKVVTIAAANLQYDPAKSAVVVTLPQSDVDAMRNAPSPATSKP